MALTECQLSQSYDCEPSE